MAPHSHSPGVPGWRRDRRYTKTDLDGLGRTTRAEKRPGSTAASWQDTEYRPRNCRGLLQGGIMVAYGIHGGYWVGRGLSLGGNSGTVPASVSADWLFQYDAPSSRELNSWMSGWSVGASYIGEKSFGYGVQPARGERGWQGANEFPTGRPGGGNSAGCSFCVRGACRPEK